jgi:hypothetical protein
LVGAGLAAGFAIASLWPGGGEPFGEPRAAGGSDARRLADLELALLEESERRAALERRIEDLDADFAALAARAAAETVAANGPAPALAERGTAPAAEAVAGEAPPPRPLTGRGPRFPSPEQRVEQLVEGGFTSQRAQWLLDRAEQLRMDSLQAVYDARREGRPADIAVADQLSLLRAEIGDLEFEQYLGALGRDTAVGVGDVFASSPAEAAGLRSGDEIVSYGGERVFDMRDLNRLTYEGEAGQPVVVGILRDGQQMQVVLPRGPVGITAGRGRGRP